MLDGVLWMVGLMVGDECVCKEDVKKMSVKWCVLGLWIAVTAAGE